MTPRFRPPPTVPPGRTRRRAAGCPGRSGCSPGCPGAACRRRYARCGSRPGSRYPPPTACRCAPTTTSRSSPGPGRPCWCAPRTAAVSRGPSCSAACSPSAAIHVIIQSCRGTGGSGGAVPAVAARAGRRPGHRGLAAPAGLVHRRTGHHRAELPGLHPVGAGRRPATRAAGHDRAGRRVRPVPAVVSRRRVRAGEHADRRGGHAATGNAVSVAVFRALLRLQARIRRVTRTLPVIDAYPKATGGRIGYFEEWLTHPDAGRPATGPRSTMPAGAPVPAVPVSLLTGWQDICLDQSLAEYQRLRAAGRSPRLVIGPWTHTSGVQRRPADRAWARRSTG